MLDEVRLIYFGHDQIIFLNESEFEILKLLIENKTRVVTMKELVSAIYEDVEMDMYIKACIRERIHFLRKKIKGEFEISTVRGVGYCIEQGGRK